MASTNFEDKTTVIPTAWANQVNDAVFEAIGDGTNSPTTPAEVKTNLGLNERTKEFDTIAALRLNADTSITSAVTSGYYTQGDRGAGGYYKDPTDVVSADNGGTVIVDAASARWKLIHDGSVSFFQFGAKADGGVTDNATFFNNVLAATSVSNLRVTEGAFYFKTQPNNIARKLSISGEGSSVTLFYRDYNGATSADGLLNFRAGAYGCVTRGIGIFSVSGRTGGCLISMVAVLAGAPDFCQFKGLYLSTTGTNTHNYAVWIDGTARVGPGAIGIRDTFWESCSVFGGANGGVYCAGAIAPHFTAVDTFPAGGSSGRITLTGTVAVPTYYANITAGTVAGMLIENTIYATVTATAYTDVITNAATAQYITLIGGYFSSQPQQFWINSTIINRSNTARAWVNFDGTGTPAIRSAFNVSSITDLGTGNYRINFTEPMGNTDYVPLITIGGGTVSGLSSSEQITAQNTSYVDIQIGSDGGSGNTYTPQDATIVCVVVFSL